MGDQNLGDAAAIGSRQREHLIVESLLPMHSAAANRTTLAS